MYKQILEIAEALLETSVDAATLKKYKEAKAGLLLNTSSTSVLHPDLSQDTSILAQSHTEYNDYTSALDASIASKYGPEDAAAVRTMRQADRVSSLETKLLESEHQRHALERKLSLNADALRERDTLISALQSSVASCEAGVRRAEELLSQNQQAFHRARSQLEIQLRELETQKSELAHELHESKIRAVALEQTIDELRAQLAGALDWRETHEAKVTAHVRASIERDVGSDLRAMQQAVANDIAALRANASMEIRKTKDQYRALVYRMITLTPLLEALQTGEYSAARAPLILSALNNQMEKLDAESLGREADKFFDVLARLTATATKTEGVFSSLKHHDEDETLQPSGYEQDDARIRIHRTIHQGAINELQRLKAIWTQQLHDDEAIATAVQKIFSKDTR